MDIDFFLKSAPAVKILTGTLAIDFLDARTQKIGGLAHDHLWAGALDIDFLLIHAQGFSARLGPKNAWNGILDMGPLLVPKDLELLEQNLTAHLCELPDE